MSENITANQQRTPGNENPQSDVETSNEQLKEQLVHRENLAFIGQLTAGILHEIKNPLNFINNLSRLSAGLVKELEEMKGKLSGHLDKNAEDDLTDIIESLNKNISGILDNGQRAERIIKSMLSQGRENNTITFVETDINQMVDEFTKLAYQGMRGQDNQFNLTFHFDYDPALTSAHVDAQSLSRVIINIVNNSCYTLNEKRKAANGDFAPELWVSTKLLGDRFCIVIKDNGLGMAKEVIDRVFHPFFTTKPTTDGTGLGLYMSNNIVTEVHHGSIDVESEVGQFTTFTITIPLHPEKIPQTN